MKKTILCTSWEGCGLGDGVMCLSSILDLSKIYNVRVMMSNTSYPIVKKIDNGDSIQVFNLNTQQYFYKNDHYKSFNLLYWQVKNSLRGYNGLHSINVIRSICELPLYDENNKKELPSLPIDDSALEKMVKIINNYNLPLIITQPYLSYHNKMISNEKYLKLLEEINNRRLGITIQIGNKVPNEMVSPYGINLLGKTSLEESLALIKLSDLVISCESFLPHAAASLKTPAIVLFCGTSPNEFGYPFFKNIHYPDIVFCQESCSRPVRWLYDYDYKDLSNCNSRSEIGWVCPSKLCEKAINIEDILIAIKEQLEIGKNRDWRFFNNVKIKFF
jgi:hypothetical protein